MPDDVYRGLAQALDGLSVGYPATESGVELRLLAKIFAPGEATLAASMSAHPELAADIATRIDLDEKAAYRLLKAMVRKGLIGVARTPRGLAFHLIPWVVGIWENQLPRVDAEMAALFEAYYEDSQGGLSVRTPPGLHRVIPVGEAIPFELEIFPYEKASDLIDGAKSWGVRDCICRVQQKLVGKGCDRPIENCLVFAPAEGVFDHSQVDRAITKEEALQILREAEEAGCVHSTGNYRDGHTYICNCCTCCCAVLRGVSEFDVPAAAVRADFHAAVRVEDCIGCGICEVRCAFGALTTPDDTCVVDLSRCVGCGLCTTVCPSDALYLERHPQGIVAPPPIDLDAWMEERRRGPAPG